MEKIKQVLNNKDKKDYTLADLYFKVLSDINQEFYEAGVDVSVNTDLSVFESLLYNKVYIRDYFNMLLDYNDVDGGSNYMHFILPISFTKIATKNSVNSIKTIFSRNGEISSFAFRTLYRPHDNYLGDEDRRSNADMSDLSEGDNLSEYIVTENLLYSKHIPKYFMDESSRDTSLTNTYYKGLSYASFIVSKNEYVALCNELLNSINSYLIYSNKENKAKEVIELTLNDNPRYHKLKHQKTKIISRLQDLVEDYNKVIKEYDKLLQGNIHKNISNQVITLFDNASYNLENLLSGKDYSTTKTLDKKVLNELWEEQFGDSDLEEVPVRPMSEPPPTPIQEVRATRRGYHSGGVPTFPDHLREMYTTTLNSISSLDNITVSTENVTFEPSTQPDSPIEEASSNIGFYDDDDDLGF